MDTSATVVGIMQRNVPLNPKTVEALLRLECPTIVVDASEQPVVQARGTITVVHRPDADGFFAMALLVDLFDEFLKTSGDRLFLIEGDMVLTEDNIRRAERCSVNTKAFYQEADPASPHAYARREGLAGVLLRSEVARMHRWMSRQPRERFRKYEGYCDTFLWYAVSNEGSGYSISTSGPDWIPVLHLTHDDTTRLTKKQRTDMKTYRARMVDVVNMAMECLRSN